MLLFGAAGARKKRAFGARENFGTLGMIVVDFLMVLGYCSLLISKKIAPAAPYDGIYMYIYVDFSHFAQNLSIYIYIYVDFPSLKICSLHIYIYICKYSH